MLHSDDREFPIKIMFGSQALQARRRGTIALPFSEPNSKKKIKQSALEGMSL
jgi:hypothetical protein